MTPPDDNVFLENTDRPSTAVRTDPPLRVATRVPGSLPNPVNLLLNDLGEHVIGSRAHHRAAVDEHGGRGRYADPLAEPQVRANRLGEPTAV